MAFERVYTVDDYFDGPRSGVADYMGRPHHYACEWDKDADDYADTFALTEIESATLSRVLEQWTIWRQWELAFHRGAISQSTHPAIPGNHARYLELDAEIKVRVANITSPPTRARAEFRIDTKEQRDLPAGMMQALQVEWQTVA
jgi:hypothetical protein